MSFDKGLTIDKTLHRIIDERNIAYLNLVVHSDYRINKPLNGIFYRASHIQQEYDRVLEIYGIDKSKHFPLSLFEVINEDSDSFLREELSKSWQIDLFLRQEKKFTYFLSYHTFTDDIVKLVEKSTDKVLSISKCLKILHLLQYCKREDLKNELYTCFMCFLHQLEVFKCSKLPGSASKTIVKILKTFCLTDFMKEMILWKTSYVLRILIECSIIHKYNFCGIFEDSKTDYPIAWLLEKNCLSRLKLLIKIGARNTHSKQIYNYLCGNFIMKLVEYCNFEEDASFLNNMPKFNRRNYLVMQVIYLYILLLQDSLLSTEILMLLWKSDSDYFLTKQEIISLLGRKPVTVCELFFNCWEWYKNSVICQESSMHFQYTEGVRSEKFYEVSPRCLKHLARCAVRKKLAASYILPPCYNLKGKIPQDLQNYLLI